MNDDDFHHYDSMYFYIDFCLLQISDILNACIVAASSMFPRSSTETMNISLKKRRIKYYQTIKNSSNNNKEKSKNNNKSIVHIL